MSFAVDVRTLRASLLQATAAAARASGDYAEFRRRRPPSGWRRGGMPRGLTTLLLTGVATLRTAADGHRTDGVAVLALLVLTSSVIVRLHGILDERPQELADDLRGFPADPRDLRELALDEARRDRWPFAVSLGLLGGLLGASWAVPGPSWLLWGTCGLLPPLLALSLLPTALGLDRVPDLVARAAGWLRVVGYLALLGVCFGGGDVVAGLSELSAQAGLEAPLALGGVAGVAAAVGVVVQPRWIRTYLARPLSLEVLRAELDAMRRAEPEPAEAEVLARIHAATWLTRWSAPPEGWLDRVVHRALSPRQRLLLRTLCADPDKEFTWAWRFGVGCVLLTLLCGAVPWLRALWVFPAALTLVSLATSPFDTPASSLTRYASYPIAAGELLPLVLKVSTLRTLAILVPSWAASGPVAAGLGRDWLLGYAYGGRAAALLVALLPLIALAQTFSFKQLLGGRRLLSVGFGLGLLGLVFAGLQVLVFPLTPFAFGQGPDFDVHFGRGLLGLAGVATLSWGAYGAGMRLCRGVDFVDPAWAAD